MSKKKKNKIQNELVNNSQETSTENLSAKEIATMKHEPWVDVIKVHVNKDDVRNGFFELDWNQYFIVQLKNAGYGTEGDSDEFVIDHWFRDLARSMFIEEGIDENRSAGFVDVNKIVQTNMSMK